MAFLFCDSFDHLATAQLPSKWNSVLGGANIGAAGGRNGTNSLRLDGNETITKQLSPSGSTCIIGFARKPGSAVNLTGPFLAIGDATVTHITIAMNADLTWNVARGGVLNNTLGTSLGDTSAAHTLDQYDYWEVKVIIHNSAGVVDIKKNGVSVLALMGIDTQNGGTAGWTNFALAAATNTNLADYDDLYVLDGTGSAPHNDCYGDVRIAAHFPTADGTTTDATPSTGSDHYAVVDEAAANSDTDYNTVTAVGDKDTLELTDLIPTGAAILAFQTVIFAKKSDAGVGVVCPVLRYSGTDYDGDDHALSTAYACAVQPYENNPGTGIQMTEAEFNALEVGYKRTA